MTAAQLAKQALRILKQSGNKKDAEGAKYYFKKYEKVFFFGVKAPLQREIERKLFASVKSEWDVSDALEFCEILVRHPMHESKNTGILLLSRYHRKFDKSLFRVAEKWLRNDDCASWALVDLLSPLILTPLILQYPGLIPRLERWSGSKNLWLRRASVVTFIPLARRGQLQDRAYNVVLALRNDKDDLIHKATGWLLREAGKADSERLKHFLQKHGAGLPRTTIRYAIERFPKPLQKKLLMDTRERRLA